MENDDNSPKWLKFQKLKFDSKKLTRKVKKAERATIKHAHKFIVQRWSNVREVRRIIALWVLAVGVLIGASGLQLVWNRAEYQGVARAADATYAEAVLGKVETLNPLYAESPAEEAISRLVFSRLMQYDSSGHLNNDLASSIQVDKTGKKYTVSIRKDAWWHDGERVTASDVYFTLSLLRNPAARSIITDWSDTSISIKLVDEYTIEFSLPVTYAAFQHALTTIPVLPEHILSQIDAAAIRENKYSIEPVGSGPFSVGLLQDVDVADERKIVHLSRNEEYYLGAPKLARLQLHAYPSREAIVRALELNEVNAAANLSYTDVPMINKEYYQIDTQPVQSGVYALFNTESPILSDKNVRQAIRLATDTDVVREKVGDKLPSLDLPFTNGQIGEDVPKVPEQNIKAAETLLDKSGWRLSGNIRKKKGTELRINAITTKEGDYERALETLVGQWSKIGVAVDTRIVDASDPSESFVQTVLQPRNYDVLVYQLAIGEDPDVYAYWHSSQATARGLNFSNYANSISDDALVSARSRLEPSLRRAKYVTFAKRWVQDTPAIGLYQSTALYVRSPATHSFTDSSRLVLSKDRYNSVLYWSVGDRLVYRTP